MSRLPNPPFVHRPNRHGTVDSICNRCYETVGASSWKADLDGAEKRHSCDPNLLEHWRKMAQKPSDGRKT